MSTPAPDLNALRARRLAAEKALESAKLTANEARFEFARALLSETFPKHALAVFVRHYEDAEPHLLHILGEQDDVEEWTDGTPQALAISEAENAIILMGHDDEILEFLDPGEEHEGWIEFQLSLGHRRAV